MFTLQFTIIFSTLNNNKLLHFFYKTKHLFSLVKPQEKKRIDNILI